MAAEKEIIARALALCFLCALCALCVYVCVYTKICDTLKFRTQLCTNELTNSPTQTLLETSKQPRKVMLLNGGVSSKPMFMLYATAIPNSLYMERKCIYVATSTRKLKRILCIL